MHLNLFPVPYAPICRGLLPLSDCDSQFRREMAHKQITPGSTSVATYRATLYLGPASEIRVRAATLSTLLGLSRTYLRSLGRC